MIQCPVCKESNHHLNVICRKCGSYLQNKIENLDLFNTIWNIIERPSKTLHNIAIATHKNYSYVISAIAGIGFIYFVFWIIKAGEYTKSLLNFLIAGILLGPPFGIITIVIYVIVLIIITRLFKENISFRNTFAVISYSLIPIVISVILFLPIEIMTFGIYFFSKNPSPYLLKPFSYVALLILDGLFSLWTLVLIWKSVRALTKRKWFFITSVEFVSLFLLFGMYYFLITYFLSKYT